ncbi:hypothetical protein [Vreelandella populi]|uniref:YMGG-like Gly-zipper domain-containing protein n=1 Tax=Vreelandella populi TaxID=2498858 RepID=A0A433LF83_9GAMM|nr:hypothetical protein [Halomonas populi]RUR35718.1 hypothetical protein ELY25_17175 [Halomonas populi]RUR47909.1 hypothetical protein ELY37_06530 [Halomonas populi]RUR54245.1 hypothetical protein ELY40_07985 [Halomonas populi]
MHTQVTKKSRILTLSAVAALTIGLAGCGSTTGERATSGAGVGAAVGAGTAAATGGSIGGGAVLGAGAGAAAGALTDEDDINLE